MIRKILCINDEPMENELIRFILQHEGIECDFQEALEVQQGLEMARQNKPDLILIEFTLPGQGGIYVLEQIKTDAQIKHIPVVMLIGKVDGVEWEKMRFEPDAWLHKPFALEDFVETINRVMRS